MTNDECEMTNEGIPDVDSELSGQGRVRKYDLEERTSVFSERVIGFALEVDRTPVTSPIISQLVSAATSIGANYCEADDAESKRDFRHKIGICRKEAHETKYWFRMIAHAAPKMKQKARPLWREAKELYLILCKIWRSSSD